MIYLVGNTFHCCNYRKVNPKYIAKIVDLLQDEKIDRHTGEVLLSKIMQEDCEEPEEVT